MFFVLERTFGLQKKNQPLGESLRCRLAFPARPPHPGSQFHEATAISGVQNSHRRVAHHFHSFTQDAGAPSHQ